MATTLNIGNEMDYWNKNKPTDRYADFNKSAAGYANQYLNSQNPFGAGGEFAGGFPGFMAKFGGNYPNINNPQTVKDIGAWNNLLTGGAQNLMQQNARTMANQGAANSRFGPAGGTGLMARNQMGVNQALGNMFGQNVAQGMGYMKDYADYYGGMGRDYMNALSDIYKTQLGLGGQMMGMNLQGLQSGGQEQMNWLNNAGMANSRDVGNYNQLQQQLHQESLARDQAAIANNQQLNYQNMINKLGAMSGTGQMTGNATQQILTRLLYDPQYMANSKGGPSGAGFAQLQGQLPGTTSFYDQQAAQQQQDLQQQIAMMDAQSRMIAAGKPPTNAYRQYY